MKSTAIIAPLLLFGYGVLRWFDGRGQPPRQDRRPLAGRARDVLRRDGLFALIAVRLSAVTTPGPLAIAAAAAGVAGAATFLWVITGDLFAGFRDARALPDALATAWELA